MPVVVVEIYSWLRARLGYSEGGRVELRLPVAEDETVGGLLARLAAANPGVAAHVYDAAGSRVHEEVAVLLNGRALELAGGLAARLRDGDTLALLPGFTGGAAP